MHWWQIRRGCTRPDEGGNGDDKKLWGPTSLRSQTSASRWTLRETLPPVSSAQSLALNELMFSMVLVLLVDAILLAVHWSQLFKRNTTYRRTTGIPSARGIAAVGVRELAVVDGANGLTVEACPNVHGRK